MKWFSHRFQMSTMLAVAVAVVNPAASAAQENNNQDSQTQSQPAEDQAAGDQQAGDQQAGDQQSQEQGQQSQEQDQQAEDQDQQAQEQNDEKDRRKLRIFELQHRDPQQLTQLMSLWGQVPVQRGTAGARIAVQRTRIQQQQGSDNDDQHPKLAIAMDSEKKLLFARGSEEQLEKLQTLIDAVDVADDEFQATDFADHRLIPIHSKDTSEIHTTLSHLGLTGQVIRLGDICLIAYRSDDEQDEMRQQAEEVIKRLSGRHQDKADDDDARSQEPADAEQDTSQEDQSDSDQDDQDADASGDESDASGDES